MVGLPPEQRDDAVELPVREAELAMKRLFRYEAQTASLDAGPEVPEVRQAPPRDPAASA